MKTIVLNLADVRDAHAFKDRQEIIQFEAMQSFFDHVGNSLRNARTYPEKLREGNTPIRTRYHDTITVFGPRGSGKTTFILDAFKLITSSHVSKLFGDTNGLYEGISKQTIEVLDIFDPTLIEEKEHVFVNIISSIKRKVDQVRLGAEEDSALPDPVTTKRSPLYGSERSGSDGQYRDWVDSLRTLAAGLPALEDIGTNELKTEKWHDPVHVMEKGLKNAEASSRLEQNFHIFVAKSLQLIDKQAFLLAFDDIDTQFKRGWAVLEVIRKYLTTPQIVTVISGDISLYAMLIRDRQWENFSNKLFQCENSRLPEFVAMVDKLEDQYLLKILKPERRLSLKTLQELRERRYSIELKHQVFEENDDREITTILESLSKDILFVRNEVVLYISHFLREPVRALVQIIHGYLEGFGQAKRKLAQSPELVDNARQDFIDSLIDVFWVPLQDIGFEPPALKNPSSRTILNTVVKILVARNLLFQGYRLKPEHLDRNLNSAMIVVGAKLADVMRRRPYLYFEYFIKVGLTREMSLLLPAKAEKGPSLQDYLRVTGIDDGQDALTISRFSSGYSRAAAEFDNQVKIATPVWQGTVALMGLAETAKAGTNPEGKQNRHILKHYGVDKLDEVAGSTRYPIEFYSKVEAKTGEKDVYLYINRIDSLFDNIKSWHKYLVTLPISILLDRKGERLPVASIHNILAVIGQLLETVWREREDAGDIEKAIAKTIKKHAQLRDYRLPVWEAGGISLEKGVESIEIEASEESIDKSFLKSIVLWAKAFPAAEGIPVHVVSKMTTRFSYTLSSMKDVEAHELYLGHQLHRFIIAFLNAVLVEEQFHLGEPHPVSRKNPVTSDNLFIQNLKAVFGDGAFRDAKIKAEKLEPAPAAGGIGMEAPAEIEGGEAKPNQQPQPSPEAKGLYEKETEEELPVMRSPFFVWIARCPLWMPFMNLESKGRSGETLAAFFDGICKESFKFGPVNYRGLDVDITSLFPLLNSVLLQEEPSTKTDGTGKAEENKPKLDRDRSLTTKERQRLLADLSTEIEKGGGTLDVDKVVDRLSVKFFQSLGLSRRPKGGKLRDQVETVLRNVALVKQ